ncbi:hypothetical protein SARC_03147 [Sphaeroforma arctica JP610]|uniref:Uncharacterized protein n=1 Tax=Sphaeroforma arctica JP610 TaxID=667725 RepID=A0A0L0G717_9EUKA|nr:hypothetical protein SARC_03147 [Sphaeroforma arctica JP610]KNC84656.1 hypothetical protein SARC_03147 [Sphaeroforma arctica JP610]|eukprot:XP_014158558.1 hypothetical protein SARC_03147 [Sphaeroforma arctica JP610]
MVENAINEKDHVVEPNIQSHDASIKQLVLDDSVNDGLVVDDIDNSTNLINSIVGINNGDYDGEKSTQSVVGLSNIYLGAANVVGISDDGADSSRRVVRRNIVRLRAANGIEAETAFSDANESGSERDGETSERSGFNVNSVINCEQDNDVEENAVGQLLGSGQQDML